MKLNAALAGFISCVVGFATVDAHAAVNLQRVQVTEGTRVDLIFDGKVDPSAIKTEFFNDTVQLSMDGVNVYPAKITSVSGPDLVKIFAYQYSPGLVRCRFTLKGRAEDYKDKLRMAGDGRILSVRFSDDGKTSRRKQDMASDSITLSARKPEKSPQAAQNSNDKPVEVAAVTADERTLLERVLGSNPEKEEPREQAAKVADQDASKAKSGVAAVSDITNRNDAKKSPAQARGDSLAPATGNSSRLTSAPELPSPARSLGVLAAICGGLGLLVVLRRGLLGKGALKRIEGHKGLNGLLGNLGLGRNERLIEVLSNHSLGPRKSIAVVRVGGRRLVLGVTNESINLITAMDGSDTQLGDAVAASLISGSARSGSPRSAQGASFEAALAGAAGATRASADSRGDSAMDLESLAMESAENPELFKPASGGAGASSAGAPRYAEPSLLRSGASAQAAGNAHGGGPELAASVADARSSAIRDRIRSRLGGMKQL